MRVSISAINLYNECPQKWYNRYVLLREPPVTSAAMSAGTIFHLAMEKYLNERRSGSSHELALGLALVLLQGERDKADDAGNLKLSKELGGIYDNFAFYPGPVYYAPSGILAVEQERELDLGEGVILVGRPDAEVEGPDGQSIYHLQHKAMMLSLSLNAFNESRKLAPHELGYKALLQHAYPSRLVKGTIMNVLKKGGIPNSDKWSEEIIPIKQADVKDFLNIVRYTAERMEYTMTDKQPRKNGDACFKYNSLCVYHPVCVGKTQINQPPYQDVPEMYPEKPSGA